MLSMAIGDLALLQHDDQQTFNIFNYNKFPLGKSLHRILKTVGGHITEESRVPPVLFLIPPPGVTGEPGHGIFCSANIR